MTRVYYDSLGLTSIIQSLACIMMYGDSCIAQGADSCYPQKSRSDLNEDNRVVAKVVVSYMYMYEVWQESS